VCVCVMTYTHPNHVGSIYPRGVKLSLLIWTGRPTECGSRVTLHPQPPAGDTKLLCIVTRGLLRLSARIISIVMLQQPERSTRRWEDRNMVEVFVNWIHVGQDGS
jgi:hypothetical protein